MGMREKLIELLDDALLSVNWDSHDYPDTDSAADILIANGVTIPVRCKDCKYWKPGDSKGGNSIEDLQVIGGCKWTNFCRRERDFCSFGERKDNG